jgi:Sugar (pentulose and hexulose) kinases
MKSGERLSELFLKAIPLTSRRPVGPNRIPKIGSTGTIKGLSRLLEGIDGNEVAGISFGGQMHGLTLLDSEGQVIRPAILWNDGRSQVETDYLNNEIGKANLSKYTGNIAFAGFTAPKVMWVHKNEPENFAKIAKILLPKDYLAYRLSGVFATDVSDASGTSLFDCENRKWSDEMLKILDMKLSGFRSVREL